MHPEDFVIVREFSDRETLREYVDLFEQAGIPFRIDDSKSRFDVTFAHDDSRRSYRIEVAIENQEKALALCEKTDQKIISELPDDYYLFQFTDEELKEVVIKSFEWNSLDVLLAEKLLKDRGINLEDERLVQQQQEAKSEFDSSEKMNTPMVVLGYIFSLAGGFFGLILALVILNSKKTTLEGFRVPRYNQATRTHAYYMLVIFILVIIVFQFSTGFNFNGL